MTTGGSISSWKNYSTQTPTVRLEWSQRGVRHIWEDKKSQCLCLDLKECNCVINYNTNSIYCCHYDFIGYMVFPGRPATTIAYCRLFSTCKHLWRCIFCLFVFLHAQSHPMEIEQEYSSITVDITVLRPRSASLVSTHSASEGEGTFSMTQAYLRPPFFPKKDTSTQAHGLLFLEISLFLHDGFNSLLCRSLQVIFRLAQLCYVAVTYKYNSLPICSILYYHHQVNIRIPTYHVEIGS